MMTPSWISTLTQLMELQWRDTSIRGPAMPSRPGAGTTSPPPIIRSQTVSRVCSHHSSVFFLHLRRWFSIQKNQLVYQKKFKVTFTEVSEVLRNHEYAACAASTSCFPLAMSLSGAAHSCGGGLASLHSQAQH